jgi:hypothetical protein
VTDWDGLITDEDVTPFHQDVSLCLRGDLVERVSQLANAYGQAVLDDARSGGVKTTADKVAADLGAAKAEAAQHETIVRVGTMPESRWRQLLVQHPPTREHRATGLDYHPDKFPPAAVAASILQVTHKGRTVEGNPPESWVRDLRDHKLTQGQWLQLWQTALELNLGSVNLGKLVSSIGNHQSSGTSSTTAAPEDSP